MTSCPHCAKARTGVWWGGYHLHCPGCITRSIARSLAAFNAAQPRATADDKQALRDLYARLLPHMRTADAHAAMLEWWHLDHERTAA